MKKTIYTTALASLLLAGCSQEESMNIGEEVQVTFTANISNGVQSRNGEGNTVDVDQLICAVCTQTVTGETASLGDELFRDTVTVDQATGKATFSPSLLKGKEYGIVFWAYSSASENAVNTEEFSKIQFTADNDPVFYTSTIKDVKVGSSSTDVKLTRNLAQINIATTLSDWDMVETLGETLEGATATITLTGCSNTYNALQGTYSGNETFTYEVSLDETNKLGDFILLGQGYTFPGSNVDCSISVKNKDDVEIYALSVPSVPTTANYRTNIVPSTSTENQTGGLMTGSASYEVTITPGYNTEETNKTPEELQEEAKNNNQENNE